MPTYVTLLRYTAQGRQAMKDMPSRVQQSKELARSIGGEVKAFYLTMGQYCAWPCESARWWPPKVRTLVVSSRMPGAK